MDTEGISKDNIVSSNNLPNYSIPLALSHPTNLHDWIPLTYLNLILQSAFIPNGKILSTLLIANAGLGKTIKLDFLRQFEFVQYTLDCTPKHISNFLDQVDRGEKKFLVIPDYIATLGHAKKTVELARSIFRAMIEEGITNVDIYGMERHYKQKIKAGLISGITPEYFKENTRVWNSDGFLQRFIPFSYSHSNKTTDLVLSNIFNKVDTINDFKMQINKNPEQPIIKDNINDKIKIIAYTLIQPREPPYRRYIQVTNLAMASAILRKSNEVEQTDIDLLTKLSDYMNRKENVI